MPQAPATSWEVQTKGSDHTPLGKGQSQQPGVAAALGRALSLSRGREGSDTAD